MLRTASDIGLDVFENDHEPFQLFLYSRATAASSLLAISSPTCLCTLRYQTVSLTLLSYSILGYFNLNLKQ